MTLLKLIKEDIEIVTIKEELNEASGKKNLYLEGTYLQSGIKNKNGRFYPEAVMDKEVNRYVAEFVNRGRAYGELGHPDGPTINPDRISHRIVSLVKEGKNYIGKSRILETPMGAIAKALIEDGGQLAVSSRGMGSLKEVNGMNEVQSDFILSAAADIVIDPSAPDAFVNGILESKQWIWENGIVKEAKIDDMKKELLAATPSNKEEVAVKMFESFLNSLKSKSL